MTFCFHENKALQQDTTLYKFIWVRSGNLTLEIDHIPIQLEQGEIISLTPLQHIEIKSVEGEYLTFLFNSNFFFSVFFHIGKFGILGQPDEIYRANRAVSLLSNDNLRNIFFRGIFVIIIVPVNKHHHICILLNGP